MTERINESYPGRTWLTRRYLNTGCGTTSAGKLQPMNRPLRRVVLLTFAAALAVAPAACGKDDKKSDTASQASDGGAGGGDVDLTKKPAVDVPDGNPPKTLESKDLKVGTGAEAVAGKKVTVQYVGVSFSTKKQFDTSWGKGSPFSFTLGAGNVIQGWDEGVAGMKVGGRRQLVIPPDLAYGPSGYPPVIAPNETLVFVVDLVGVA
jgi:peptidylprolyl isomerase